MKSDITKSFNRLILSTAILLLFTPIQLLSQITFKYSKIQFMHSSFEYRTAVKELFSDSILVKVFVQKPKFIEEKLIPITSISSIAVKHGKNRWKGGLRGAMIGAVVGTIVGISIGASEPGTSNGFGWGNASVGQGIVGANLVTIPIASLIGLSVGVKNKKKFELNGEIDKYRAQINEMKSYLLVE